MKIPYKVTVAVMICLWQYASPIYGQEAGTTGAPAGTAQRSGQDERPDYVRASPQIEALIAQLQSPDYRVKVKAALELRSRGADAVTTIPALIDNLGDVEDGAPPGYHWNREVYNPQSAAVEALQKIIPHSNGWGLAYARKAFANGGEVLRQGLAKALPSFGDKAIPLLLTILSTDNDGKVLESTVKGLGSLGTAATPAIKDFLDKNPKGRPRREALLALTYGKDPQSLPILIKELDRNDDEWLKSELQNGISRLAAENEIGRLKTFLHDKSMFVGMEAVGALKRIGSPNAIEVLFKCIDDKSVLESTRSHAVTVVSDLNDPRALQVVLASYRSREKFVRYSAISAMKTPNQEFVKPLMMALNNEDAAVRRLAIESLMKQNVDRREVFDLVLKMLSDKDDQVKRTAGDALESMTGKKFGTDATTWNAWLTSFGADFNWGK